MNGQSPRLARILTVAVFGILLLAACQGRAPVPAAAPQPSSTIAAVPAEASPTTTATTPVAALVATVTTTPAPPVTSTPVPPPSATPTATPIENAVQATGELAGSPPQPPAPRAAPAAEPTAAQSAARQRTIVLDPGHGGPESGAVNATYDLKESDVNLDISQRAADLLRSAGYRVVLTREEDVATDPTYRGGGYAGGVGRDLQARIDTANAAGADLFFSVHNNGSANPEVSGTEVWYNSQRPFADRNEALPEISLDAVVGSLREAGYQTVRRGIWEDSSFRIFRGQPYNIYVLGPGTSPRRPHEPTHMPGVLVESLFLTHAGDAWALSRPEFRQAIARSYLIAVEEYFAQFPD